MQKFIPNYLPLDRKQFRELFDAIRKVPRTRHWVCTKCGKENESSAVSIYSNCFACGTQYKIRSFGAYDEVEDLIDLVLSWLGEGNERELVLSEFSQKNQSSSINDWKDFFENNQK